MSPGRVDQQPPRGTARLVPQKDGYADYVDQQVRPPGQHRSQRGQAPSGGGQAPSGGHAAAGRASGGPAESARLTAGRAEGQRSIRSMISLLLVVPLLSLVALYAYSAYSAVGNALARQHEQKLSSDLGTPVTTLYVALDSERADALLYLANPTALMAVPGHRATPLATWQAAESVTERAVAGFEAASANAAGLEPSSARPLLATLTTDLNTLPALRQQITTGDISLISALNAYDDIYEPMSAFSTGFFDPDAPIPVFEQSNAVLEQGEATTCIAEQAALVGAVAATGGDMTAPEHLAFAQAVADEKQEEAAGGTAIDWQESPDPYPAFWRSALFQSFEKAQAAIDTANPGVLPASDLAEWNKVITPVIERESAETAQAQVGVTAGQNHEGNVILEELVLVGGIGLFAVLLSAWLLLRFGNRITRELTSLRGAARTLAGERLPAVVARLRDGEDVDPEAEAPPLALRTRTREVTETAEAFSLVQRTAVQAAVDQTILRKGISSVFRSLARRNHSLVQRQLKMLDGMERSTQDPDQLAQLFQLDHLTTRMRRQAEGLLILSGASPGRGWRQPVPVVEVLRGAISEIEDYARVDLLTDSPDFIQGAAVADVTHLLAELIENAVLYSPPSARVQVRGSRAANGYAVEVEDRGLGIRAQDRAVLNERLARPPEFDIADSDQLGLFVVARLALRQDIRVSLRESGYGGTTAIVLLPGPLVVAEDEAATAAPRDPAPIGGAQTGGAPTGSGVTGGGLAGAGFTGSGVTGGGFTGGGLTGDESAPVLRRQMPALPGVGAAAEPGVRTMPLPGDRSPFGSGASGDGTSGSGASPASQGHEPSAYPRRTPGASGARSAFAGQPSAFKDSSRTAADHGTDRPSGTTESGLPRRDRGANVAPQLRDSPRLQPRGPLSDRSPEQARALLSSIQRGLRTGRNATVGNNPNNPNNANRGTTGEDQR